MQKFLSDFNWDEKLNDLSLENMWRVIKDTIIEAVKRYVEVH